MTVGFDFLGARPVNNMPNDVQVYRVNLPPSGNVELAAPASRSAPTPSIAPRPALRYRLMLSGAKTAPLIAVLAAINLFSWDGELWFQWPALAILFVCGLRAIQIVHRENAASRR